jgi:hypothetical protein
VERSADVGNVEILAEGVGTVLSALLFGFGAPPLTRNCNRAAEKSKREAGSESGDGGAAPNTR